MRQWVFLLGLVLLGSCLTWPLACAGRSGATLPAVPTLAVDTPTVQSTAVCSNSTTVFGVGALGGTTYAGEVLTTPLTLTAGTLQAVGVYLSDASGLVRGGVYSDSGGPYQLLCQSSPQTAVNGWDIIYLPAAPVTAGPWWPAVQTQNSTVVGFSNFNGTAEFYTYAWGPFAATFPIFGSYVTNGVPSIQLFYCPGVTPTLTPSPTPSMTPTPTATP